MNRHHVLPYLTAVLILISTSGCLDDNENKEVPAPELLSDIYHLDGLSTEQYQTRIDFNLAHDNITEITFRFMIEDDDQGTNPDVVDHIDIAEHDTEGPVLYNYYGVTGGGSTPFEATVTLKISNTTLIDDEWQLYFYVNLTDSDDSWPGPLIFRGTRDTGFAYTVEAEYTYYEADPYIDSN